MVKGNSSRLFKVEKVSAKRNAAGYTVHDGTESEVQASDNDEEEYENNDDETSFDKRVSRCFVVNDVLDVVERTFKANGGVEVVKDVFNILLTDPLSEKRILSVWGKNAINVHKFFK